MGLISLASGRSVSVRGAVIALGAATLLSSVPAASGDAAAGGTPNAAPSLASVVDLRAAHHRGFDRFVLEFDTDTAPRADVRRVRRLIADGSGRRIRTPGRGIVQITVTGAQAHGDDGLPTVVLDQAFALPALVSTRGAGDFEGTLTLGLGLAKRSSFHVHRLSDPGRLVVDIDNRFAWSWRRVTFIDASSSDPQPVRGTVLRPVRDTRVVKGLLDRVFAGPTLAEQADGLRLVSSGATGYSAASKRAGVARVQLTGGCRRDGARSTIADSIMPTLRRLPSVRWVKLYDRRGQTNHPAGPRDSRPACLTRTLGECLYLVKDVQDVGEFYLGEFLVLFKAHTGRVAGTGGAFYSEGYLVRGRITPADTRLESRSDFGDWSPLALTWQPDRGTFAGWRSISYTRMRHYSGGWVPSAGTPCG